MTKVNAVSMFERIKVAVDNKDNAAVMTLKAEILTLPVIDNYYIVKAHKTVCVNLDASNIQAKSYFDFAKLGNCQREIYARCIDALYNYDDDMGDSQAALAGLGNVEAYIEIAKTIFK